MEAPPYPSPPPRSRARPRRIRHPGAGLHGELIGFCQLLRRSGLKVTTGHILDIFRSLPYLDISDRRNLYLICRANLTSARDELAPFDALFAAYWGGLGEEAAPPETEGERVEIPPDEALDLAESALREPRPAAPKEGGEEGPEEEGGEAAPSEGEEEGKALEPEEVPEGETPSWSPYEVLARRDFSNLQPDQVSILRRLIAQLVPKLATKVSRRRRPHVWARELDLRRSFHRSIRHGGEVIKLYRRRRRIQKTQIVLICDVSGSMDSYSHFLIQFLYSLQREIRSLRTFVFSTRLTEATPYLRRRDIHLALERLASEVHDWSGGTQIGKCLREFNLRFGRHLLNSRSVVLIISDGWDRGDTQLLAQEMERLRRMCHRLIWLNPLLGSPGYRPIDRGMRTALPYVDEFLAAHNLESLVTLTKHLAAS
ncbi:MAG: VWA domain-containing protein [Nitrospinota bacterium]